MFRKNRWDHFFYPGLILVALCALFLVAFQANGALESQKVEAERQEAIEQSQEQETDANTEATDDGDWDESGSSDADSEASKDGDWEEESDATSGATEDGDWEE